MQAGLSFDQARGRGRSVVVACLTFWVKVRSPSSSPPETATCQIKCTFKQKRPSPGPAGCQFQFLHSILARICTKIKRHTFYRTVAKLCFTYFWFKSKEGPMKLFDGLHEFASFLLCSNRQKAVHSRNPLSSLTECTLVY